jgi:hypothetical protein
MPRSAAAKSESGRGARRDACPCCCAPLSGCLPRESAWSCMSSQGQGQSGFYSPGPHQHGGTPGTRRRQRSAEGMSLRGADIRRVATYDALHERRSPTCPSEVACGVRCGGEGAFSIYSGLPATFDLRGPCRVPVACLPHIHMPYRRPAGTPGPTWSRALEEADDS